MVGLGSRGFWTATSVGGAASVLDRSPIFEEGSTEDDGCEVVIWVFFLFWHGLRRCSADCYNYN